jgi:hypothetical protein
MVNRFEAVAIFCVLGRAWEEAAINFAGWLLRQLTCEAVVVSDAFRRAIAPVQVEMGVSCHDERLFVDRNLEPQLLYLLSLGDFRSTWLEENQVRCWFDEDELHGGHSARRGMEQGLRSSRYLLVCASANLASALWANQEIDAVLHLDVDGRADPKVLVLKLNEDSVETAIPLLLQGKKWFEYRSPGDFERLVGLLRPSS